MFPCFRSTATQANQSGRVRKLQADKNVIVVMLLASGHRKPAIAVDNRFRDSVMLQHNIAKAHELRLPLGIAVPAPFDAEPEYSAILCRDGLAQRQWPKAHYREPEKETTRQTGAMNCTF